MNNDEDNLPDIIIETPDPDAITHRLNNVNPRWIGLPGPNWSYFKPTETSLIIIEMTTAPGSTTPRTRKYVRVNLVNGICTSYVFDREISDVPALTTTDVERCVEELDMMHICVGGPSSTDHPSAFLRHARVDCIGQWRHDECKIVVSNEGLSCKACKTIEYDLQFVVLANVSKSNDESKISRINIGNFSHRRQSQIIALQKRRENWHRKKRHAEKEMKFIDEMISEITEKPDERCDEEDDD